MRTYRRLTRPRHAFTVAQDAVQRAMEKALNLEDGTKSVARRILARLVGPGSVLFQLMMQVSRGSVDIAEIYHLDTFGLAADRVPV
eukprot:Skav210381  [mRNA]  locus=scaffold1526:189402:201144:+ [translate_table: standard]